MGVCVGCSGDNARSADSKGKDNTYSVDSATKKMSLRIIPHGEFGASHDISIMIVGLSKALDVSKLSDIDVQAVDQEKRHFPVTLKRYPGESSKFGPYTSLVFDAREAKGFITVTGRIAYKTEVYMLDVHYIQGGSNDTYFWREDKIMLDREN